MDLFVSFNELRKVQM